MKKYYRERYRLYRRVTAKLADMLEVNRILELIREEARLVAPTSMESCILLLDQEADSYTRPMQCDLYDTPKNCQSCKRNRPAVQAAIKKRNGVVLNRPGQVKRHDGSLVETGPEVALPIFVRGEILAVGTVLGRPGTSFTRREFFLFRDLADISGNHLLKAKLHWEVTQEKLKISQTLKEITPFVPRAVARLAREEPGELNAEKQRRQVTVLFMDIEGYTQMFNRMPEEKVNRMVENFFSAIVDPIHRSGGDINETAGDGLMIIFLDEDAASGARKALEAAFDIYATAQAKNSLQGEDNEPLKVNMGINCGQALVGPTRLTGSLGSRMTYTASGSVTNLAARLASLAQGGDILLSQAVHDQVSELWSSHLKGEYKIKGIEEPVKVYSVLGEN